MRMRSSAFAALLFCCLGAVAAAQDNGIRVFADAYGDTVISRDGRELAAIRPLVQLSDRSAIAPYPTPPKATESVDDGTGAEAGGQGGGLENLAPDTRALIFRMPGSGPYIYSHVSASLAGRALKVGVDFKADKDLPATPGSAISVEGFYLAVDVPAPEGFAGTIALDGRAIDLPAARAAFKRLADNVPLNGEVLLPLADGGVLRLAPPAGATAVLMDMRLARGVYSLRLRLAPEAANLYKKDQSYTLAAALTPPGEGAVQMENDGPSLVEPGPEWIPLHADLDIEKGSALDLSNLNPRHGRAGALGRVVATENGEFAFADEPGQPRRRFWGPNLVGTALTLSKPEADRLVERFVAHGYNTVRIHHPEAPLVDKKSGDTTKLRPDAIDKFDYLVAKLIENGFYLTIDLYCSKPILEAEIWDDGAKDKEIYMRDSKVLLAVNDRAFEHLAAFNRNLLGRVNPYLGHSLAEDPALAWINTINEGSMVNPFFRFKDKRVHGEFNRRWNEWLTEKYGTQEKLKAAWGARLEPRWNLARKNIPYGYVNYGDDAAGRDTFLFANELETAVHRRFIAFMRDELKCRALLTNINDGRQRVRGWTVRREFDYVDIHNYLAGTGVQINPPARVPTRLNNIHPAFDGAYPVGATFQRLLGKPITISEYSYAAPNPYRGAEGLVYGMTAALQDYGAMWYFTYAHTREVALRPTPMSFFDLSRDPFHQAADRALAFLYLREDFPSAKHTIAIAATEAELNGDEPPRSPPISPEWSRLAMVSKVGTAVTDKSGPLPYDIVVPLGWEKGGEGFSGKLATITAADPYAAEAGGGILAALRATDPALRDNPTNLDANLFQSDNGAFRSDAATGVGIVETDRTAGGFGPADAEIAAGALEFTLAGSHAALWAASLDGRPLAESRRILLTHLTDLQNVGISFADQKRRILTSWGSTRIGAKAGTVHHLMRAGTAEVALRLAGADKAEVHGLEMNGRRQGRVAARAAGGKLRFTADTRGDNGGRMYYEIVVP